MDVDSMIITAVFPTVPLEWPQLRVNMETKTINLERNLTRMNPVNGE